MATTTSLATEPKRILLSNGNTFTYASNAATSSKSIPLIDVSRMYSNNFEDRRALAEEVRKASHEIGFFTIINHVRQARDVSC
jgi:hypothetical protein